jgi:aminoglycoside phosphotransferase (APT) family kinase protein
MLDGVHDDQLLITVEQVASLVADQLPALIGHDVVQVDGAGTVHAIFRIGSSVTARFPLRPEEPDSAAARLRQEAAAAAEFVRAAPFRAPQPLGIGRPGHGYPLAWATQSWLAGATLSPTSHETSTALALDVAELVNGLRRWETRGRHFTGAGRGGRLADHDAWVAECIERSEGLVDLAVARRLWTRFRSLPHEDHDVMCHGDLIPANLLVSGQRLSGVLDTGGFRAADPALDLVVAWHCFAEDPREQIRTALACSDLQWERGAAWAFQQAIGACWYYRNSNSSMAEMGRTTLERLLSSFG